MFGRSRIDSFAGSGARAAIFACAGMRISMDDRISARRGYQVTRGAFAKIAANTRSNAMELTRSTRAHACTRVAR